MGISASLLAALINSIAIPEITAWLRSRHDMGHTITDADVRAKLASDTTLGVSTGETWLADHPAIWHE